jgi:hypothetical protein
MNKQMPMQMNVSVRYLPDWFPDETPKNDYSMLESTVNMEDYGVLKTMLLRLKRLCVRREAAHILLIKNMRLTENQ